IGSYSLIALKGGMSTMQRKEAYSLAVTLFMQRPLLGIETGGFPGGYPHNIFLEIATENGLVGLIIFICFLFAIARIGFRYLISYFSRLDRQSRITALIILTVSLSLFVEKQFSYGLDMHKDLFAFLGLVVNLPLIARSNKVNGSLKRNKLWITKSSMKNNTERKGL
ncbi:O-antigen ligase family protein, partial [Candidatus Aerophobetes bacterium]|nr:O-antigen ligase family protein [Candidatus Aerophobetes bacterium]